MEELKNKAQAVFRDFSPSSWAIDNATSVFILTFMVLLFGIESYREIPKEQFPEIDLPTVYINTPYFGNSATDIENLVTRPIEKELQGLEGIKDIKSTSIQDYSVITVEFESGVDIDEATVKVKDAVDKAKNNLPNDLDQEPSVMDVNLSELPIVTVNVSGDYPNDELRNYAEFLQDKIEALNEVNEVDMKGDLEREVKVDVDLLKMESMEVSFGDIANAIQAENLTMSGGEIVNNDFRRAIRVKGEFERVEELESVIVKSEYQQPVFLRDIAEVTFGYKERTSIARSDGLQVISLDIIKRKGENLLTAADNIKAVVDEARKSLPADLKVSMFNDQSVYTRNEVNNLENSIISGVILVVLILLFFLGLRNASFVGLAIPLSMLMGILLLSILGVTLNIVVLFALILALGLLVDNAIVVVENIFRYMQEGYDPVSAAKRGAGEVAVPIIASTATTLAAFIPLAFWPGIVGSFMQYFPITLIIVLTSSLFVALVINPVFARTFMKVDERADDLAVRKRRRVNALLMAGGMLLLSILGAVIGAVWMRNLFGLVALITLVNFFLLRPASFGFQNKVLPALENAYNSFLNWALKVPVSIFIGTFLLLIASIILLGIRSPEVKLFGGGEPIYVNAFVELPLGKDIEATDKIMRELESRVQGVIEPTYGHIVEAVLSQIGENTADPNTPPEPGASPQKARLTVQFVKTEDRGGISTFQVMDEIRNAMKGFPGVQISVDKNADGPPTGKPINLEIRGDELDQLLGISQDLTAFINDQNIPGIEELKSDIQLGKPELIVNVDREAARRYGVSTFAVADALRTAVFGLEVSQFKQGEEEYPIYIRLNDTYRYDVDKLLNQKITFRDMASGQISQVPIAAVANVQYTSTYSAVKRKDLERVVTIYSNVVEGYNANEIVEELRTLMKGYELPAGFSYEFTGEQEQQAQDTEYLSSAFLIAVFSIFIILVTQFNSIIYPFIIIISVLFSTIGVFLGYSFSGATISVVFSGVGIISLAGVVVNNAIVLIDYINLLIQRKQESLGIDSMMKLDPLDVREAIIKGGATRLRPVLLTAITTVLGLIPLAIGFNFNFFTMISETDPHVFIGGDNTALWGPMAWTVIYGLTFATFLTLIVVPAMFWLAYRMRAAGIRLVNGKKEDVIGAPGTSA
ncbi:MAG: efflux RND transporter permease subunit [Saprospiraceae bacterium]